MSAALNSAPVTIHGDGEQTRDFTYVGSVCNVITEAVQQRTASHQPVNLAFGGRLSLLQVLDELETILGRPIERVHTEPRAGDVRDSQADQAILRALFPTIEPVDVSEGLRRTVAWLETGAVM